MKILVTGAGGMIGRAVIRALAATPSYQVIACYHTQPAAPLIAPNNVATVCDLLDASAREELLRQWRPDCLIHLAWCPVGASSHTTALHLAWLEASVALLKSFTALGGQRFIGSGSIHEYGIAPEGACTLSEAHTAPQPRHLYGKCKFALGTYLMALAADNGLSVLWPRLSYVFGPGCAETLLLGSALTAAQRQEDFICHIAPSTAFDIIDVRDVAQLYVRSVAVPDLVGMVNFATGTTVLVRELLTQLFASCPERLHFTEPFNPPQQVCLDNTLVRQKLGLSAFRDVLRSCEDFLKGTAND